ncbi:MAG: protein kinase domain-containing protein, partial [Planctomycetota bacterium]
MPILRVIEGPDEGKSLPLDLERGQLFCGTGKKVTFRLSDDAVAERQFRLVKDGDRMTVYHLEGAETFVNDEEVTDEIDVGVGDTLTLGDTVLQIDPSDGEADAKPARKKKAKKKSKKKAPPPEPDEEAEAAGETSEPDADDDEDDEEETPPKKKRSTRKKKKKRTSARRRREPDEDEGEPDEDEDDELLAPPDEDEGDTDDGTDADEEKEEEARPRKTSKRGSKKSKSTKKKRGKKKEPDLPPLPEAGETVGGCEIQERLGEGALCVCFRAVQRSMDREVALKILRPELAADEDFRAEFVLKARATGQDRHPNIVQIIDVGEDGDRVYVLLELMSGGTLAELLADEGALDWEASLPVAMDTAEALRFAHGKGLVHQGLRPENVLLTTDGEVKVGSLGVAGLVQKVHPVLEDDDAVRMRYLAPEQIEGGLVDIRTDLYALGVVFYQMLAGRTPFEGSDAAVVRREQVEEEPPPLGNFCARAPEEGVAIIHRLLSKRPLDRYGSPDDLIKELDHLDTEAEEEEGGGEAASAPRKRAGASRGGASRGGTSRSAGRRSGAGAGAGAGGSARAASRSRRGNANGAVKPVAVKEGAPAVSAAERMRRLKEK